MEHHRRIGQNIFRALLILLIVNSPARADDMRAITGFWKTQDGDGIVEFFKCDQKICGRFHWLKDDSPEQPSLDDKNPDPQKRTRPLCEMQFMGDFTPQGEGRYTDGWIYSPHDGNTYPANLTLSDPDTIKLRGYLLLPIFGETQTWKRTLPNPACRTATK